MLYEEFYSALAEMWRCGVIYIMIYRRARVSSDSEKSRSQGSGPGNLGGLNRLFQIPKVVHLL